MRKEDFSFDSRDGKTKIHAVRYYPEDGMEVKGVVQIVHGMAEYVERYEEFAEYLTARGYVVTGEDHLGHGTSVTEEKAYGYFCEQDPATVVVRDVHRLKKLTEALYPDVCYFLMGHSMGSFITRNYIMRYGTGIDGAIIMGTGMQPKGLLLVSKAIAGLQKTIFGGYHKAKLLDKMAFGSYNKHIPNARTSFDWLTRETDRVDKYIADPLCGFLFTVNGFATLFELIYRLTDKKALRGIPANLPLLMVSGMNDPVGNYGKGVNEAYDSICEAGAVNVEKKLYPGARHELLNETNRGEVMDDIEQWLTRQSRSR